MTGFSVDAPVGMSIPGGGGAPGVGLLLMFLLVEDVLDMGL